MHGVAFHPLNILRWAALCLLSVTLTAPAHATGVPYEDDGPGARRSSAGVIPGVVVVKVRAAAGGAGKLSGVPTGLPVFDAVAAAVGAYAVEPAFPFLASPAGAGKAGLQRAVDTHGLTRIYYVRYGSARDPWQVAAEFEREPGVEYAEPLFRYRLSDDVVPAPAKANAPAAAVPNDPLYPDMDYLGRLQFPAAWDVVKGEQGSVVIAIVDGGTDWQHPDLDDNVWTNPGETPNNGRDDDDNGFVDDVHGWNFVNDTPDPTGLSNTPQSAAHGTMVAGVAAAVANNGAGTVGSSWNATYMPINAACPNTQDDSSICFGYNGIIYAAINGADIINASWGGDQQSNLAEDVINFAYDSGSLVVTAAGNGGEDGKGDDNDLVPQYPANYPHVLSVGATFHTSDGIAPFSNYGRTVHVFAPGINIVSTIPRDQAQTGESPYTLDVAGTSFSSPMAAGLAALVKTFHPDWNVDQVREQIRVTSDNIDGLNDPRFAGKLGNGRINAFRAVTEEGLPAVRVAGAEVVDSGGNETIERGETAHIRVYFTNFLAPTSNVNLVLFSEDSNVSVIDGTASIPSLSPGDTVGVDFSFALAGDTPNQYVIRMIVDIAAGPFPDYDVFDLLANPPAVVTLNTGSVVTSVTDQGNIGWTGFANEPGSFGEGFQFEGVNHLFEGGLLVGTSASRVSDAVRGEDGSTQQDDFTAVEGSVLRLIEPGAITYLESVVTLTDSLATEAVGVRVLQEAFADTAQDFVIYRYSITNRTSEVLSGLYAGLFFDWDLNEVGTGDYARYDGGNRLGIVQNKNISPDTLVGVKLLTTNAGISYRSIDNPDELYDGFDEGEKWRFLSEGVQTTDVSATDVSHLIGAGPFRIKPECSVEVAFAMLAAGSAVGIRATADTAQAVWDRKFETLEPNRRPAFVSAPPDTAIAPGQTLAFTYEAEDPDACDFLYYRLLNPPANAAIDSTTGQLQFTPANVQIGTVTLVAVVSDGTAADTVTTQVVVDPTPTPVDPAPEPVTYALGAAYPNPAAPPIRITYQVPRPATVTLRIYDLLGREVATLVNRTVPAGAGEAVWDGRDGAGQPVANGLYLYRFTAEDGQADYTQTRKLVLVW